jgi:hypothetical protein
MQVSGILTTHIYRYEVSMTSKNGSYSLYCSAHSSARSIQEGIILIKQEVNNEHYTPESVRAVLDFAPRHARRLGTAMVESDALVLGIMSRERIVGQESSVARQLRDIFGISMGQVNTVVAGIPLRRLAKPVLIEEVRFSPGAADAIKAAEKYARTRGGRHYIVRLSDIGIGLAKARDPLFSSILVGLKLEPLQFITAMSSQLPVR